MNKPIEYSYVNTNSRGKSFNEGGKSFNEGSEFTTYNIKDKDDIMLRLGYNFEF